MNTNVNRTPKICERCGKQYVPESNRQKYCYTCQPIVDKERALQSYYRQRDKRIEYMRKYNKGAIKVDKSQSGTRNNNYRNGKGLYSQHMKDKCERCGSKRFLCVHHRDRNRLNNDPENLETLCKSCHQKEHEVYKNFTKGIVRSSENKESEE